MHYTGGMTRKTEPTVGLALGSGSARGWTHIGVIRALEEMGVCPQIVAGTSIGALVGAVYVSDQLEEFAEWVQRLTLRDVINLVDLRFSGGVVKGEKLFGFFRDGYRNPDIEELEQRYVSVATEMQTGRESWLTKGPILPAARASCAIPGLFSPVQFDGRWMLDGGLVNPVPVSAARALGADVVIAVNLNAQLRPRRPDRGPGKIEKGAEDSSLWGKVQAYLSSDGDEDPGLFDAITASINIMQDRITRSRMAGDPPEITLSPRLSNFALMDFHRADEAIAEGERLVTEHAAEIRGWLGRSGSQAAD